MQKKILHVKLNYYLNTEAGIFSYQVQIPAGFVACLMALFCNQACVQ